MVARPWSKYFVKRSKLPYYNLTACCINQSPGRCFHRPKPGCTIWNAPYELSGINNLIKFYLSIIMQTQCSIAFLLAPLLNFYPIDLYYYLGILSITMPLSIDCNLEIICKNCRNHSLILPDSHTISY